MDFIKNIDHWLFARINLDWTNSFFDWFFPAITDLHKNPLTLVLVLPLLLFWYWRERGRALRWMLVALVSVGLSDVVSYRLVKPLANRDRPQFTGIEVNLRTHRHSGMSFPSNHASNMFAVATALSPALPQVAPVLYIWAFLIAYSRVYVGVHFPFDVIGGAMIGSAIALILRRIFRKQLLKDSDLPKAPQ